MMWDLDLPAAARAILIYAHLLAFAAAVAAIAFGDFAIFAGQRVNTALLKQSARIVSLALAALWMTGLGIIWLDTRFALDAIAGKPKLLAKLAVVSLLSLNGVLLHRLALPRITRSRSGAARAAALPVVLGGVSAASWGYAAFLGVAGPFAPLGFSGLMGIYFATLTVAVGVAWVFVRPCLARHAPLRGRRAGVRRVQGFLFRDRFVRWQPDPA